MRIPETRVLKSGAENVRGYAKFAEAVVFHILRQMVWCSWSGPGRVSSFKMGVAGTPSSSFLPEVRGVFKKPAFLRSG